LHDELNVVDGQVDQHTSDLGSFFTANNLVDELVDDCTNLSLVVGILNYDSRKDLLSGHEVPLVNSQLLRWLLLRLHWLWLRIHNHLWLRLHHLSTTITLWLWLTHIALWHAVLVLTFGSLSITTTSETLLVSIIISSLPSLRSHLTSLLLSNDTWQILDEQLEIVLEILLVRKTCPCGTLGILLAECLEIMLVLDGFVLKLANFLDLVVINYECPSTFNLTTMKLLFGRRSFIRLPEANES